MSKFSLFLDRIISKENKEKIKQNLIDPIVNDLIIHIKPFLLVLLGLYLSLLIPLLIIIMILLRYLGTPVTLFQ
jgi:hypothetical protein